MDTNKIKNSHIVVTGGAGFIGSTLVKKLVNLKAHVKVFDNFSSGKISNLSEIKDKIEIVQGDILDKKLINKHLKDANIVFHHAAQLEITTSIDNPLHDLTTNTIGTINVLKASASNHVSKVINISSACVYGQALSNSTLETDPTDPNWEYGVSKLSAEKYAQIIHCQTGLDITSLRYSIVYGPNEWYGRALTIFLKRALNNQSIIVFGKGDQVRDYIFVDDVVDMNIVCATNKHASNQVFNVSTNKGTSILNVAKIVKQQTGNQVDIIHDNIQEGEKSKYFERKRLPQELKRMVLSNQKAYQLLKWQPKVSIKTGIKKEIEWLAKNINQWKTMSY